jgi:hypothetical protein
MIIQAVEQIRDGVGPDGNWMIDLHQKFDFHEAVEVCRLMEPYRPFCVEDPLREEQFRTQIPKAAAADDGSPCPGRGMGHESRLQSPGRASRHRLRACVAPQRRRHH